ncbi:TPA: hypothetical protein ACH3X1_015024 [Trebouxia sp. C0004]
MWSIVIFTVTALAGQGLPWCHLSVLYTLPLLHILKAAKGWSWAFDPDSYHFHLGFTFLITAAVFAAIYIHATHIWDNRWWTDSQESLMSLEWATVFASTALSSKTASEHVVWKTWALSSFGQGSESDMTEGDDGDGDGVPVVPTVSHWSPLYSQAHSRGLFDKNMVSLGADPASPSGTTHSAASPHREPVITHAPSRPTPDAAAPVPGGLAATPETASIATLISGTAPATPGMAPTSPKTAANTPTGVAISAEAPGLRGITLQAAGGASISVPPPGPGSPVVATKAEPVPGPASTPLLTSATTGSSVIPSARTAHPALAGAAIGDGAGSCTKPVKSVVYTSTPKLAPAGQSTTVVGIRSPGQYIPAVRTAFKSASSSAKQSTTSETAVKQPLASNTEASAAKKRAKINRQRLTGMTPLQRAKSELLVVHERFKALATRRGRQNRNTQDEMPVGVRDGSDAAVEQANKTTLRDKVSCSDALSKKGHPPTLPASSETVK